MQAEAWTACTASFILANATDLFIETAAHCVNGVGNRVWFFNSNQSSPGIDASLPPDGEAVFVPEEWDQSNYNNEMARWDFAFIRINPARYTDVIPQMCAWDGPKGLHNETGSSTNQAYFYGHGIGVSSASPERVGVGPTWDGGPLFYVRSVTNNRDSGGPWITSDGLAIGHETAMPEAVRLGEGTDQGVHIQWILKVAAERGFPVRLVEAGEDPLAVMQSLAAPSEPWPDAATPQGRDVPGILASGSILALAVLACLRRR